MKTPFWFLLFLLLFANIAQAQESTKKHTVKKGETVYQIGRLYNVSPKEILKLNPGETGALYVGAVLTLPPNSNLNNSTYSVLKDDTKFSISKKFDVSVSELEKLNPHIKNELKVDQTLILPENAKAIVDTAKSKNTTAIKSNKTHVIGKGETLYSISKKYNVGLNDLKSVNPALDQNDISIGTKINIPSSATGINNAAPASITTEAKPEEVVSQINNTALQDYSYGDYKDLRLSVDKTQTKDILFLSPFSQKEFNEYERSSKNFNSISESLLKRNLEFYRGAQKAIDSAKNIGLNININLFKIQTSDTEKTTDLNSTLGTLENIELVMAPYYKNEVDWISLLALEKKIPVIAGYSTSSNVNLTNIFEGFPSVESQKLIMLDYLDDTTSNITVLIDSDRTESKKFIKTNTPSATIIETDKKGNYSSRDLISTFSKTKMNYVIIDSKKTGVFLSSTNSLLREMSNYKIQLVVLESSLIPSPSDITPKRFEILKLLYPKTGELSDNSATAKFLKDYRMQYGSEATEHVLFGFDLTFDSLLRLFQNNNFEESVKLDKTVYLNFQFNYIKNNKNRYINHGIIIADFSKSPINIDNN